LLDRPVRQRWKQLVKIKKRRDLLHDDVDFESFDPQLIQVLESRAADSRRLLAALVRSGHVIAARSSPSVTVSNRGKLLSSGARNTADDKLGDQ